MAISLNYLIPAEAGGVNKQNGKLELGGILDVIRAPFYPLGLKQILCLVSFNGVEHNTLFELRVNDPEHNLIKKVEFGVEAQPTGLPSKQLFLMEEIALNTRGKYTADILIKTQAGFQFVTSVDLFTCIFPPKRVFEEGEVDQILASGDDVIKSMIVDFSLPEEDGVIKLELHLDPNGKVTEGCLPFPENNILEHDGKKHDLEGVRRDMEWMFGRKKPNNSAEGQWK